MDTFYCSEKSRNYKDSTLGTASYYTRLILLEYNEPFGASALKDSNIPEKIKLCLNNYLTNNSGTKILLIRQSKRRSEKIIVIGEEVSTGKKEHYNQIELDSYDQLNTLVLESLFKTDSNPENRKYDPIFLVCTNGKKDKCCSKFGLPIFNEFASKRLENAWQCSHIGGDRFAPTGLVLPSMNTYGHIKIENVASIIEHEENNEVFVPNLRGNAGLSFFEQAAEGLIRKKYNLLTIQDVEIYESSKIETNLWSIVMGIKQKATTKNTITVKVCRKKSDFISRLTCDSENESYSSYYTIVDEQSV